MATWYVDKNATGATTGLNPIDAWTDITSIVAPINAGTIAIGDTVLVRQGQTHTANLNSSTDYMVFSSSARAASERIKIMAVNASWQYDGMARVVIDGASTKCRDIISAGTFDSITWVGFELKSPSRYQVYAASAGVLYWNFEDCIFRNGIGLTIALSSYGWILDKCQFISCQTGIYGAGKCTISRCVFRSCSQALYSLSEPYITKTIIASSVAHAMRAVGAGYSIIEGCIFDANPTVFDLTANSQLYITKSKFTGNANVIQRTNGIAAIKRVDCEYFGNGTVVSGTLLYDDVAGLDSTLSSDEYVDRANGNWNKISAATNREVGTTLDGANYDYSSIGLHPAALSQANTGDVRDGTSYASGTKTGTMPVSSGGGSIFDNGVIGD